MKTIGCGAHKININIISIIKWTIPAGCDVDDTVSGQLGATVVALSRTHSQSNQTITHTSVLVTLAESVILSPQML